MATAKGTIILHYGPMGISLMERIEKTLGKGAVIDTNVARMAGADFAFGAPDTLAALRGKLEAGALAEVQTSMPRLDADAQRWLAVGQQGVSSLTLFHHLTQTPMPQSRSHPHDLDDFGRCKRMIEQVPSLRALLPEAASLSPVWARIVDVWDTLCTTLDAEIAAGERYAPKAARILEDAIKG
jgi:hypothetical protein